jgi:hypothetical protein
VQRYCLGTGSPRPEVSLVADGGRNAARGLRYQYLRTLEALMAAVEEPRSSIEAIHIEGRANPDGANAESIDFELSDGNGHVVLAAQVKARLPGSPMGAGYIFGTLADLVRDRDAFRYELLTNAVAGDSASSLLAPLNAGLGPTMLRTTIDTVLASVSAERRRDQLRRLDDEHLVRLGRASVEFDPRDDAEITESLRARLRLYRSSAHAGLGNQSAGLMIGYLVAEIFRRAGDSLNATLSVSDFHGLLLVDGVTLTRAIGKCDWGAIVGPIPAIPDVRRQELLDLIQSALPLTQKKAIVSRCAVTGMSGIGKTSLASGYLLERADLYDVIFWVDAENEPTLITSFSRIFRYLHSGEPVPLDPSLLRETVLSELSTAAGKWLMILDNCVHLRLVEEWVPRAGTGHVILTTTDSAIPPRAAVHVEVGRMAAPQAVDLLRRRLVLGDEPTGPDLKNLVRLAKELECWPLALELASAYLHGTGLGIDGIPEYLDRLKLFSLGDYESIPLDYPRTLIQAIELCLQRIRERAAQPESGNSMIALLAQGMMRMAAYMSSRQIPAYLIMSVPDVDVDNADAFRGMDLHIVDDPNHPPASVVRMLRTESLVGIDERLPPDSVNSDYGSRYDYTITINSVLQEVIRARVDNDQMTSIIIHRLAWHTERWMKAAIEAGAHERALILSAHASTLERHAARLNVSSDFVAYLRGNLASIQHRQHQKDRAVQLLRSEIDHYRGRAEEYAQLLTCQASMQLAAILSEDSPVPANEIAVLLGDAYFLLARFAFDNPEGVATLLLPVRSILRNVGLDRVRHEQLAMLAVAIDDLMDRLPTVPLSTVVQTLHEAAACLVSMNFSQAAELCQNMLSHQALSGNTPENLQIRCEGRRLLIESLVGLNDVEKALDELDRFIIDARPQEIFVRETQQLVHNAGLHCAMLSFRSFPRVGELLSLLLSDGRAELIERSYPGETSARIRLLRGVEAFNQGDLTRAQRLADEFMEHNVPHEDISEQQQAWFRAANLFIDVLTVERGKSTGVVEPLTRTHDIRGLARLMRLPANAHNMLHKCDATLLPLYTALALICDGLAGPPGNICVPVCYQLLGALKYLGYDGQVVAASAMIMPDESKTIEHIGEYKRRPKLDDDGSTNGHAVLWLESFSRMVDPTIVQSRSIQTAARFNADLSFPVVLPVANLEVLLGAESPGFETIRASHRIAWILQPQWTGSLTPVRGSDLHTGIAYGQLALAYAILDVMRGLDCDGSDLQRLRDLHEPMATLLDEHTHLPPLPDKPPASFLRLRRGAPD